jgi:hypothetical protein
VLLSAIEGHVGVANVVEAACTAVCNVFLCTEGRRSIAEQHTRAEEVVTSALAVHAWDAVIVEQTCIALQCVFAAVSFCSCPRRFKCNTSCVAVLRRACLVHREQAYFSRFSELWRRLLIALQRLSRCVSLAYNFVWGGLR